MCSTCDSYDAVRSKIASMLSFRADLCSRLTCAGLTSMPTVRMMRTLSATLVLFALALALPVKRTGNVLVAPLDRM
jgi:hypothetical protein